MSGNPREKRRSIPTIRGEIHIEAMQVRLIMQHLSVLSLELGCTILTL